MMLGVWAWIRVVFSTNPKVSVSRANVSLRIGSGPGSLTSLMRGMPRLYAGGAQGRAPGERVLDCRQGVEQHAADNLEAPRRHLVERVRGGVPGRVVEIDQQR